MDVVFEIHKMKEFADFRNNHYKINIPIKKPDLINHIRFSKSESKVSKKQKLPQKTKIKKSKSSIKNATTNIFGSDQSKKNKKK